MCTFFSLSVEQTPAAASIPRNESLSGFVRDTFEGIALRQKDMAREVSYNMKNFLMKNLATRSVKFFHPPFDEFHRYENPITLKWLPTLFGILLMLALAIV